MGRLMVGEGEWFGKRDYRDQNTTANKDQRIYDWEILKCKDLRQAYIKSNKYHVCCLFWRWYTPCASLSPMNWRQGRPIHEHIRPTTFELGIVEATGLIAVPAVPISIITWHTYCGQQNRELHSAWLPVCQSQLFENATLPTQLLFWAWE